MILKPFFKFFCHICQLVDFAFLLSFFPLTASYIKFLLCDKMQCKAKLNWFQMISLAKLTQTHICAKQLSSD